MDATQAMHDLALIYAKTQFSFYRARRPIETQNDLEDADKLIQYYLKAFDIFEPQRSSIEMALIAD